MPEESLCSHFLFYKLHLNSQLCLSQRRVSSEEQKCETKTQIPRGTFLKRNVTDGFPRHYGTGGNSYAKSPATENSPAKSNLLQVALPPGEGLICRHFERCRTLFSHAGHSQKPLASFSCLASFSPCHPASLPPAKVLQQIASAITLNPLG